MTNLDRFQVYLLSKMTAESLVHEALRSLGVADGDMPIISRELAEANHLEEPLRQADAIDSLIGGGAVERGIELDDPSSAFAGSLRREYTLPLWPDVELVVNRHPAGYAWGVQFEQRVKPSAQSVSAIHPWHWTEKTLVSIATTTDIWDRWSDYFEATLTFAGAPGRYRARFDLGLLQSFVVEP